MDISPSSNAEVASGSAVQNELLRVLFDYWASLASDGGIPLKRNFDIVNVPIRVWPHMYLIDVLEAGRNHRLRVFGTYLVAVHNRDLTGRQLVEEEIPHITKSVTYSLLERLARDRQPLHYHGPVSVRFAGFESLHEQVMMPLGDDTGRIVAAVGAIDYRDARPNHGYRF